MKILYVGRSTAKSGVIKDTLKQLKQSAAFYDQEGFFEQALYEAADVTQATLEESRKLLTQNTFDALIINWKQGSYDTLEERIQAVLELVSTTSIPKALMVGAAQAGYLPPEDVLDAFDVVFKREPFRDRSRYAVREENRNKLVPTMISCPFVSASKPTIAGWLYKAFHRQVLACATQEIVYEVGFSGADAAEHTLRHDVWQRVQQEGFSTIGGLQQNPYTKQHIPDALQGPRLTGRAYRDSLCAAKINLALDGIGEYTFRHQELLCLGAFMMSGPSIREIELPMPLKENVHYVAFDDLDDMVEKIRFYLQHVDERHKIAAAGKTLFDEYYDPARHGQEIIAALKAV